MTFRPLFFLPPRALRWAYTQAYAEHLMDTPVVLLFISIDNLGIWFPYKGDEVVWTWPWRRKGFAPFISLGFTGTGAFGDARYWTLKELDDQWERYYTACEFEDEMQGMTLIAETEVDDKGEIAVIETFNQPRQDGAIGRVV